jgi:sarcosine oxidase delta subunit
MPHLFRKNTNFQKKGIDIVREEPKKKSDQQELKYGYRRDNMEKPTKEDL